MTQSPSCVVFISNRRFARKLALGATPLNKTAVQAVLFSLTYGVEPSDCVGASFDETGEQNKKSTAFAVLFYSGDPYGNRTHVTAVKGPCLSRLTNGPLW